MTLAVMNSLTKKKLQQSHVLSMTNNLSYVTSALKIIKNLLPIVKNELLKSLFVANYRMTS
jgi:hypothetical protein